MKDTRDQHGYSCYCESCCQTAHDWYCWRNEDKTLASGSRYWTLRDALKDKEAAKADGLLDLYYETPYQSVKSRVPYTLEGKRVRWY